MSLNQQPIFARTPASFPSVTSTSFFSPLTDFNVSTTDTTSLGLQSFMPAAGVVSNFFIGLDAAPGTAGSGKQWLFTLRKNGVDTSVTITISETATSGSYSAGTVSYSAGDSISWSAAPTGTPTNSTPSCYMLFSPTTDGDSIFGLQFTVSTSTTVYPTPLNKVSSSSATTVLASATVPIAVAGTMTATLVGNAAVTPGTKSGIFTWIKNGVVQDGTGSTVNTAFTYTGGTAVQTGTYSLPVSPGDTLALRCVTSLPSGSLAVFVGCVFNATNPARSLLCGGNANAFSSVAAASQQIAPPPSFATSATEATIENQFAAPQVAFALSGFQMLLATPPASGKTWTIALRKNNNAVGNAPSVTVGTTGAAADTVSMFDVYVSDKPSLRITSSGSPASSVASWSFAVTNLPSTVTPVAWPFIGEWVGGTFQGLY